MSNSDNLSNNIIYKLIVLDILKDKYNWKEM
jgi:hypothetical protein